MQELVEPSRLLVTNFGQDGGSGPTNGFAVSSCCSCDLREHSVCHCSVDNSECAILSEDFPGSRWHFQREAVTALCQRYMLCSAATEDAGHVRAFSQLQGKRDVQSICIAGCGDGKVILPPTPLADRTAALSALMRDPKAANPANKLAASLRLAGVGPLYLFSCLLCSHAIALHMCSYFNMPGSTMMPMVVQ